eukprot:scaffold48644_cov32-Phaeocystis_antarctica.AAC.1
MTCAALLTSRPRHRLGERRPHHPSAATSVFAATARVAPHLHPRQRPGEPRPHHPLGASAATPPWTARAGLPLQSAPRLPPQQRRPEEPRPHHPLGASAATPPWLAGQLAPPLHMRAVTHSTACQAATRGRPRRALPPRVLLRPGYSAPRARLQARACAPPQDCARTEPGGSASSSRSHPRHPGSRPARRTKAVLFCSLMVAGLALARPCELFSASCALVRLPSPVAGEIQRPARASAGLARRALPAARPLRRLGWPRPQPAALTEPRRHACSYLIQMPNRVVCPFARRNTPPDRRDRTAPSPTACWAAARPGMCPWHGHPAPQPKWRRHF